MARWLLQNPRVLMLSEPTRGIDVGSKVEIYRLIDAMAHAGMGVLVMSTELPEILGIADRIIVMYEGRITGEFTPGRGHQRACHRRGGGTGAGTAWRRRRTEWGQHDHTSDDTVEIDEEAQTLVEALSAGERSRSCWRILVLALIIILTIAVPTARQSRIYFDLLREISPNLIAAVGVALLMLAGEFDLSIGAMLALTGVVTVTVFNVTGNMWLGILAGLLTGPLIGAINGYLVTRQRMPSLMTTLGMMFALRGLVYV